MGQKGERRGRSQKPDWLGKMVCHSQKTTGRELLGAGGAEGDELNWKHGALEAVWKMGE